MAATDEANKIKNGWHPRVKTTVNDDLVRSCALSSGNPFVTLYIFFQTVGRPRAMPFLSKAVVLSPVSQSGVCFEDLITQIA